MIPFCVHQVVTLQKRGANLMLIRTYSHIKVPEVTQCKETFSATNEARPVRWLHFFSLLCTHCVTAEFCSCATYSPSGICDGIVLWLIVKGPGLTVPLQYSWKYIGVPPFRYGCVRRTFISRAEPPHVRECKSQANPSKKGGKKKGQNGC